MSRVTDMDCLHNTRITHMGPDFLVRTLSNMHAQHTDTHNEIKNT